MITSPLPSHLSAVQTLPQVEIRWRGVDPDQPLGHGPPVFKYRFVTAHAIAPNAPGVLASDLLQDYFGKDFANGFADWDSLPADSARFLASNRPQRETPDDGEATWNLLSRNGQDVVSGIYLFSVEAPGFSDRGKFVVIR